MADFEVRGSADLQRVARHLKEAADGKLRRETLAAVRLAAEPGIPAVRASALSTLPKRGGLAAEVAGQKFAVRTALAAGKVSIVGSKGMKELESIDSGTVRHKTFGKPPWHAQKVTPGFFTKPLERLAPGIRLAVLKAIAHIGRGL